MKSAKVAELIDVLQNLYACSFLTSIREPERLEAALKLLERHLAECKGLCGELELHVSTLHIDDLLRLLALRVPASIDRIERGIMILSSNIQKEASLKLFFSLDTEKSKHYQSIDAFGEKVADQFPSASYDVSEANRCYAVGRNTACVFHLMRVLESGLAALAKQFNCPYDHTNWETIILRIEKEITNIDKNPNRPASWKDEREFYSQCASHFRVLKDAWRNYTAHVRGKYDEQEALDMLGNVRGFMQKLATRLHE